LVQETGVVLDDALRNFHPAEREFLPVVETNRRRVGGRVDSDHNPFMPAVRWKVPLASAAKQLFERHVKARLIPKHFVYR
jgi:hypothetical protein